MKRVVLISINLVYRVIIGVVDALSIGLRLVLHLRDRGNCRGIGIREVDVDELLHNLLHAL